MLSAWVRLGYYLFRSLVDEGARHIGKRVLLFVPLWLLAGLLSLLHSLGFLLDELLFPGYRKVEIKAPVFIVGVPRSGTTLLQRVLARDHQFTTLTLWECLLAPSISERYFWSALGRVGAVLGKPLAPLLRKLRWGALDRVHQLGLQQPEEDFLLLFPRQACFVMAIVCPKVEHYWRLSDFDRELLPRERRSLMRFYRSCLQRHLYYHGDQRRLLSKNPSFTSCMESLAETFPDARFVACVRDPGATAPSQLSALQPAMHLLGNGELKSEIRDRLLAMLHRYYQILAVQADRPNLALVPMGNLKQDLEGSVRRLYAFLGQALPPGFELTLARESESARRYRSGHRYRAEDYGLKAGELERMFADVWPRIPRTAAEVA